MPLKKRRKTIFNTWIITQSLSCLTIFLRYDKQKQSQSVAFTFISLTHSQSLLFANPLVYIPPESFSVLRQHWVIGLEIGSHFSFAISKRRRESQSLHFHNGRFFGRLLIACEIQYNRTLTTCSLQKCIE